MKISGEASPNLPHRGRGTAAAAVRRAANLIFYSCRWQLYHNFMEEGCCGRERCVISSRFRPVRPSSVSLTRASSPEGEASAC